MKSMLLRMSAVGLSALLAASSAAVAAETAKPAKEFSFGVIKAPTAEQAKVQALEWLKSVKGDEAKFQALWADAERPVLDKVADTLALGSPDAARLLAEARTPDAPAPKEVPALLKDQKQSAFFRQNLALAYGKALAGRRIYEDGLEALKAAKGEQTVDPAAYYFHKAVCEHALYHKDDATRSIARLLDEVSEAPERYKMVAALMYFDMQTWQDKGLARIGQLMGTVERRLDVARGGPQTQKVEAEIVRRLEEEIKKLENQANGSGSGNGGGCPSGSPKDGSDSSSAGKSSPKKDSTPGGLAGPGKVDPKNYKDESKAWGGMPERERAQAMMKKVAEMPPSHRKIIEDYYKKVASEGSNR